MTKEQLVNLMNELGFEWVCDVKFENGHEMVASKIVDSEESSWKILDDEGLKFASLFKGMVKRCCEKIQG